MNHETENTLRSLFEEHSDALFRYAFFRLEGDRETALDLVQDTYYKIGVQLKTGKEIDNPRAYLYRMITNLIIDRARGSQAVSLEEYIEETGDEPSYEESQTDKIDAGIEVEKIYAMLAELSEFDKDIFILRFVEELSPSEIAEIYSKPTNAITVRLHRLKEKVITHLTPNEA